MPIAGLDPGKLDRRITIQTRSTTTDSYGTPIETWADTVTVWSGVDYPKTGSTESFDDKVNIATTAVIFTIRDRTVDPAENRIQYDSGAYDIERVAELGRNSYLQITAKKRENDGRQP